jgi:hypothetical protein
MVQMPNMCSRATSRREVKLSRSVAELLETHKQGTGPRDKPEDVLQQPDLHSSGLYAMQYSSWIIGLTRIDLIDKLFIKTTHGHHDKAMATEKCLPSMCYLHT